MYIGSYLFTVLTLSGVSIGLVSQCISWIYFVIVVDYYSILFFYLLFMISIRVFIWSYYYIDIEENYSRFISLVILFVLSIIILIFFGSLLGSFIGWDGLGLTSFLLVIYYKNRKSLGSGIITALTNRLGDGFLLVVIGLIFTNLDIYAVSLYFLILTSITKRAQIPFSSWLPSAIAAPTPVRALVHSSTLVTAGIYIILRFNWLSHGWILWLGSLTILIAGFCACVEIDIKKVVALSTLSQLGVIIVALGLENKVFCFFHLFTHALFKALLFVCVGVAIHRIFGRQDYRSFSGGRRILRWSINFLIVASISLIGLPFISGFYRKDSILESFYSRNSTQLGIIGFLLGVGLTTAYRIKVIYIVISRKETSLPSSTSIGGFRLDVKLPTFLLGVTSVLSGAFISSTLPFVLITVITYSDKIIPLIMIFSGTIVGWFIKDRQSSFFRTMWSLSPLYQFIRSVPMKGYDISSYDISWVEFIGGPGLYKTISVNFLYWHPLSSVSVTSLLLVFLRL